MSTPSIWGCPAALKARWKILVGHIQHFSELPLMRKAVEEAEAAKREATQWMQMLSDRNELDNHHGKESTWRASKVK